MRQFKSKHKDPNLWTWKSLKDLRIFSCDPFAKAMHPLRLISQPERIQTRLLSILIVLVISSSFVFGQSTDTLTEKHSIKQEDVFEKVDVKPLIEYEAWRQHLKGQLQVILDSAEVRGIPSGKHIVKVRFIVEKDGSITNVKALNNPGYGPMSFS